MKATITRISEDRFACVTDIFMSDGTFRSDYCMKLDTGCLRSCEQKGHIRIDGLMRVNLSPEKLAKVSGLSIGESVEFGN